MRDEGRKKSDGSTGNPVDRPAAALTVERVGPSEFGTVARMLAVAYSDYPLQVWAMPKASTRLDDAAVFFEFYLKRMRPHNRDVFVTSDRSAVLVVSIVRKSDGACKDNVRSLPRLFGKMSPVEEYFKWVETFRPNVDHRHVEFVCSMPGAPRGTGSFLYATVLKIFEREGIPTWTWTADPRILPFFRSLGFEICDELRRDAVSPPAITMLWRPMPLGGEGVENMR